jgi:hypothetical protein
VTLRKDFTLRYTDVCTFSLKTVENLAYRKESWINNRRQLKRHVRNQWLHGHASRAVDGVLPVDAAAAVAGAKDASSSLPLAGSRTGGSRSGSTTAGLNSCTVLDNFYVDRPIWMVDLGKKMKVSGVIILTWLGKDAGDGGGDSGLVTGNWTLRECRVVQSSLVGVCVCVRARAQTCERNSLLSIAIPL